MTSTVERTTELPLGVLARDPIIECAAVRKCYGDVTALDGVDVRLTGQIIGLLGPNGAGKSTLMKCLLGLERFEGRASVLGLSPADHSSDIRDRVGYMPEREATIFGLDAVGLCTFAGELSGLPRSEAIQRAHIALDHVGFDSKRYQQIDGYSTGQKQRVKLAQALVHGPQLLFLDEPTSGLHPSARDAMLALIGDLPRRCGCTVVLSTHLLPDVERICDHAVIMDHGRVRFVGTVEALRKRTSTLVIEVRGDAARLATVLNEGGATCRVCSGTDLVVVLPHGATTTMLFDGADAAAVVIRSFESARETIEEAFVRVIAGGTTHDRTGTTID